MNAKDWLSRLIAIDTTSRNSNLGLIDVVNNWFADHRIQTRLTYNAAKDKANLFATLPAKDGDTQGGILFSGHTDVVPVDGQTWDTNPFEAIQIEDKIVGRGASDMKAFIAVVLALLPEFQTFSLSKPIHFAFSYDEEIGCLGAPLLIADFQQHAGIKPSACIVGEPTLMRPVVAHKGINAFRCRIHGRAAHSSLTPEGSNSIEYAAKFITYLRKLADELRQIGPFDPHFDVPFTSISTNMIHGGVANNIVPEECEFSFEFRHLPQVDPRFIIDKITSFAQHELLPQMQGEHTKNHIKIEHVAAVPSFDSPQDAMIYQLAREITQDTDIHKVAYATEAGLFQQASIPTIICGPGSIEQAHRANEFVSLEQLEKCAVFLRKIVQAF